MTTLPKNREEPHTKVLLPRGACSPAPQPGMKLVHGPVIIGDSKNTGSASTTFPWGSKRTGNSESSDTWPDTINSDTHKPQRSLTFQLSCVESLLLTTWAEIITPNFTSVMFEKAGQSLISLTLLTLTTLLLVLLRTLCSNTSTPSGFQLA